MSSAITRITGSTVATRAPRPRSGLVGQSMEPLEARLLLSTDMLQALDSPWGVPNWLYRSAVTVDHTKVAGDLTDFPLLVKLTSAELAAHAQSDGDDIRFTAGDGQTPLAHEIESYDPATGALVAWVRVPQLSDDADTGLYLYYGNPAAPSQADPQAVWDSGFLAVHHLEELTGPAGDSTAWGNDGAALNGVTREATGVVDGADGFDGVNDRIVLPQVFTDQTQFTVEGWLYTGPTQGYAVSQRDPAAGRGMFLQYYSTGNRYEFQVGSGKATVTVGPSQWHYMMGTFDGGSIRLYMDGQLVSTAVGTLVWPTMGTYLGDREALGRAFLGTMDEIRLSDTVRGADYAATNHANQSSPGTFLAVGPEEVHLAPQVLNETPPDGAMGVDPDTSELAFDLTVPGGGLASYTVATSPDIGSGSGNDVSDGRYAVPISGLLEQTAYTWTVTVTGSAGATERTFTFTTGSTATQWAFPDWRYRRQITIDHTKVAQDLSGFPVLIDITDADLGARAQTDGRDILFATVQGQEQLAHEVEFYDSATGHLVAWVKVPLLSASQDTLLHMYYGNDDVEGLDPQQNPPAVWNANYMTVQHLEELSGPLLDSTANGANGTPLNGVQQDAAGRIDGADGFDGVDDRVNMEQLFVSQTQFTFEGWLYTSGRHGYAFSQRDGSGHGMFLQYYPGSGTFQFYVGNQHADVTASTNAWHQVVATYDGTTARLYVDNRAPAVMTATLSWPNVNTYLGNNSTNFTRPYQGLMDEVRLSNTARSGAYVATAFANQSSPSSFYDVGDKEISEDTIIVSNTYPADGAVDVELHPTLEATIREIDGNAFDWTVDLRVGGQWQELASGTGQVGRIDVSVPTTLDQYNTQYFWRVTARLSSGVNQQTEQVYGFTTRGEGNYAPRIGSPVPADQAGGVPLNPTLSVEVVDIDDDAMDISFSIRSEGSWHTLANYYGVAGGTYSAECNGLAAVPLTDYLWRVRATDQGSGQTTETTYAFSTGGALQLKWQTQVDMSGAIEPQIHPLMGDVDDDGQQEIVFTAGDSLWVLDGTTGSVEWAMRGGVRDRACELIDLDNDGVPEILVPMYGPRLRALNGDGSIRWTSAKLSGEDMPMFPIIGYDIDGDGYPTLYFASEDVTPLDYSGNPDDYTGAVTMLDHNGNVLVDTWIYHPCWGGFALGDTDYDGRFELYVADRREGYHNVPANGLQAYDAHTLEALWERPDLHHSSPMPILADVVGDDKLEVVAQKIVYAGPAVLNSLTGQTILNYTNRSLPTHATGTIHDLDGDGNLELIMATSYPITAPCNFVVFDLVTGQEEFHPTFEYHATWPPKLGDVTGDGRMDILAAMGNQSNGLNYPLLIYNDQYELIDRVDVSGAGQLAPARVYDTDGDGLNEVVLAGVNGLILAYDTHAPVPDPAPRTWVQMYSEYRRGVAEYVELPGPKAPFVRDVQPADGQPNVGLEPELFFRVHDFQKDTFDLTVELRVPGPGGWQWVTLATYDDRQNGTFTVDTQGHAVDSATEYLWRATGTDEHGNTAVQTFTFTTLAPSAWGLPDWSYRRAVTVDHAKVPANLADFPLMVTLTSADLAAHAQSDGDDIRFTAGDGQTPLAHEIESYNAATGALVAWVKLPQVSADEDTRVYLYYGNPTAADQADPEAVWDSGFLAVHHLEELTGPASDSSASGNDGDALNGVARDAAGVIDGADGFDGANDRIVMPQVFTNQTQFTVEGWLHAGNDQGYAVSQRDLYSGRGMFLQYYAPGGRYEFQVGAGKATTSAGANQWHYLVGTFDGTNVRLYMDGRLVSTATGTLVWPALATYIGDRAALGRAFLGRMDEVRLSGGVRGAAYVAASYANQASPSTFYALGEREQGVTRPVVYNPVPAGGQQEVPMSLSELRFDLLDLQGDTMSYTVATSPDIGGAVGNVAGAATVVVPVTGVEPDVTYSWTVAVTDGNEWTYQIYSFTTYDPANLLVDSDFDASVDDLDLRTDGPGQDWYESRNDMPQLVVLDQTDVAGNTGKKAKFIGSTSGNAYLSQPFRTPQTGQFSVRWDIYVDEIIDISGSSDCAGWMFVGNDPGTGRGPGSNTDSRFVYMTFGKSGGGTTGSMDLLAFNRAGSTVTVESLELDRWYTIRVDVDVPQEQYAIYVDGQYKTTVSSRSAMTSVSHVTFAQWDDGAGTFHVDNVRTPVSSPNITNPQPGNLLNPGTTVEQLQVDLDDPREGQMAYTITTSPDIGGTSGTLDGQGTVTVPVNGVQPFRKYTWQVDVSNGVEQTVRVFSFTTYEPGHLLADATFDASADSEDLRADAPVPDWFESRNDLPTLVVLDQTNVAGNTSKKAKFIADLADNVYLSQELRQPQTGRFSIQWDIYVDAILDVSGAPDMGGWMFVGNDPNNGRGPSSTNRSRFVQLAFYKNGGADSGQVNLVAMDRDGDVVALGPVELDRWYTIRVDLDLLADNYDVSVDGAPRGTVASRTALDSVGFVTFAQWNDGAGTFYVDNVRTDV